MCDDFTVIADEAALTRREFAAMGAAVALVGAGPGLKENTVKITTADGTADCFFVHPTKGKHPGVILWPDIGGLRDVYKMMARRLAAAGYAVLAVNQYYRSAPAPVLESFAQWRTPEGQAKLKPMIAAINPAGTIRDGAALVKWLDASPAVNTKRKIGSQGYCMGGAHAVRTASASSRVAAVASFHGGGLAAPDADSPIKLIPQTSASYLFAFARNDDARAPLDKDALRAAADAAYRPAEIEVYPADHGWCVGDSPSYDATMAEKAWGRLLALYAKL